MPLCGLKKSKKQRRDHSPPYRVDQEAVTKVKELEEDANRHRQSYEQLKKKYAELEKKQLETSAEVEKSGSLFSDLADAKVDNFKEAEKKLEREFQQKNDELEQKLKDEFESQRADLEESQRKLNSELDRTKERLEVEANDRAKFEAEKERLKREKDTIEQSLNLTKKELEIAQKESHIPRSPTRPSEEWKAKILIAETELQKEREQRMNKERELSRLLSESEQLQKEKEAVQNELTHAFDSVVSEDEINTLKQSLETAENNYKNELSRKENELEELNKKLQEEADTKESLMTRLSAATAAKVLDNNPNISDLSDPNRPQKLGERFMTLYENQWTEASDALEKLEKTEDEIIGTLLDLVVDIYKHCKESSETQLSRVEEDIFLPPLETPASPLSPDAKDTPVKTPSKQSMSKIPRFSSHKGRPALPNLNSEKKTVDSETNGKEKEKPKRSLSFPKIKGEKFPEIPVEVRKGIKEYRKAVCKKVTPVIEREVMNMLRSNPRFGDKVVDACMSFISACVEICWLMNIQDPPVSMEWKAPVDSTFNVDNFKAYLKNGSHVDYVVWPTLFLYEGGPVLSKGVAQGMDASD